MDSFFVFFTYGTLAGHLLFIYNSIEVRQNIIDELN